MSANVKTSALSSPRGMRVACATHLCFGSFLQVAALDDAIKLKGAVLIDGRRVAVRLWLVSQARGRSLHERNGGRSSGGAGDGSGRRSGQLGKKSWGTLGMHRGWRRLRLELDHGAEFHVAVLGKHEAEEKKSIECRRICCRGWRVSTGNVSIYPLAAIGSCQCLGSSTTGGRQRVENGKQKNRRTGKRKRKIKVRDGSCRSPERRGRDRTTTTVDTVDYVQKEE